MRRILDRVAVELEEARQEAPVRSPYFTRQSSLPLADAPKHVACIDSPDDRLADAWVVVAELLNKVNGIEKDHRDDKLQGDNLEPSRMTLRGLKEQLGVMEQTTEELSWAKNEPDWDEQMDLLIRRVDGLNRSVDEMTASLSGSSNAEVPLGP